MKALVCTEFNSFESLTIKDIQLPTPAPDEVLINVHACSISFPDLLILQNKYQFKPTLPFSPGGEISGIIDSVGKNISKLKKGDRVIALSKWGGLAEQAAVNVKQVFTLPSNVDFITGASTLYSYGTSYHALKDRAQIKQGETLLVLGASGGVGLAAVELGKIMGAKVIAAASTDEKLKICTEKGAEQTINYTTEDLRSAIKLITNGKGVDVVYDAVGGQLSEPALRSMAWGGRFLVVGFAAGEIPAFPANIPLLKGCSIVGVFFSGFIEHDPKTSDQNFDALQNWIQSGKLKPYVSQVYPFEKSIQALKDLSDRKVVGKAVIQVS
jgi:NADPH:quinone reductase-like Zn-dependent oxidoreductase